MCIFSEHAIKPAPCNPRITGVEVSEPIDPDQDNPFVGECQRLTRRVEVLESLLERVRVSLEGLLADLDYDRLCYAHDVDEILKLIPRTPE